MDPRPRHPLDFLFPPQFQTLEERWQLLYPSYLKVPHHLPFLPFSNPLKSEAMQREILKEPIRVHSRPKPQLFDDQSKHNRQMTFENADNQKHVDANLKLYF